MKTSGDGLHEVFIPSASLSYLLPSVRLLQRTPWRVGRHDVPRMGTDRWDIHLMNEREGRAMQVLQLLIVWSFNAEYTLLTSGW